jgi:hypothetical protein
VAHRHGGDAEEVSAVAPVGAFGASEFEIQLMDERRGGQ